MCIKFLNVTIDFTFVLTYLTSPRILALKLFPLNFFFFNCRMLFSREWVAHLHHKYCKANSIAMRLKYLSFSFSVPRQLQVYTTELIQVRLSMIQISKTLALYRAIYSLIKIHIQIIILLIYLK